MTKETSSDEKLHKLSHGEFLLSDAVAFVFVFLPVSLSWALSIGLYLLTLPFIAWYVLVALFPIALCLSFIFVSFILRIALPKVKPGVYEQTDTMTKIWYCHFLLGNSLQAAGLQPLIYSSQILKFLYWSAMGATVKFGVLCNHLTRIRDFSLLEIGKGCSFSADTHIACHMFEGSRLVLAKVKIGDHVFIGMDTVIGPRTKIEDGAWIGAGNVLFREHIKTNEKVESYTKSPIKKSQKELTP